MNKQELRHQLKSLTSTEQLLQKDSTNKKAYDYHDFSFTTDKLNEKIYLYTFKEHLKLALTKTPHVTRYQEKLPLLIFKHARFSYTPFHIHDFVELNYVYRGQITMIINDKTVVLNEGDVCLLDTEVCHRILETGEEDILINFLINKDYFSFNILKRLRSNSIISNFVVDAISETQSHNQYIVFYTRKSSLLRDAVEGLLCNYYDFAGYSVDIISSYLIIVFYELLKVHQEEQSSKYTRTDAHYILDILNYIDKNYSDCSLAEVAEVFGYNTSYLSRYIKKHTGMSFIKLIQDIRMKKACIMLENSSIPVEAISLSIGYKNVSFFYRKFFQAYGVSPNEYRILKSS